jgi:adenylosuccinate synthase
MQVGLKSPKETRNVPTTIVVGGQYGSEGKGKLVAYLAHSNRVDVAVRCGGPNAGHSVTFNGRFDIVRQVPAAVINPRTRLLVAAGALIEPPVLFGEIRRFGLGKRRLGVDGFAAIVSREHKELEARLELRKRVSSTLSGTGAATASKILREPRLKLARQIERLREYIVDVAHEVNRAYDDSENIVIEGTQGFGLSLHHSLQFPFVTSRDTSASNFLSEVGLSPTCATQIIMVVRTHPIRVPGHSGPLQKETSWNAVSTSSGSPVELNEFTSVTKRLRRVGLFECEPVKRAAMVNRPTALALQGLDYLSFEDRGKRKYRGLSRRSKKFIADLERLTNVPVKFIFTGPELLDVIETD